MKPITKIKQIWTGFAVLFIVFQIAAQDAPPPPDAKTRERMDAARAAFLTERLDLTANQAEQFWPVYHEFNKKRHDLRKTFMEARRRQGSQPTPEEQRKLLDLGISLRQQELDLEKSYSDRFLQVISAEQVLRLNAAERDFQEMVARHLRERRDNKPGNKGEPRRHPGPPGPRQRPN